jgi:hypothetical protein
MSASEKLKALHQTRLAELGGQLPGGHPFISLWAALPQIVAMVEASERLKTHRESAEMRWMSVEDATIEVPARVVAECGRALAALDEALS